MTGIRYLICLATSIVLVTAYNPCNIRTTDSGTICVCNSTYCDNIPSLEDLTSGQYQLYSSSHENLGFFSQTGNFSTSSETADVTISISNLSATHQTILGFGGAFTDATGININRLSNASQEQLLNTYFSDEGIQYSIGRVPIGGTDFSTRGYTYCDEEDETLASFALKDEDYNYKIPYIQRAIELRGSDNIKLFASAWSAPIWMKTNNAYNGYGKVEEVYYGLWAEYYIKFFEAYEENNITFWGVTTQNEPATGLAGSSIQSNGFTSDEMREWVKSYIGPTIRNSSYSDLKIMLHDDQRLFLPILKTFVLSDSEVVEYADGVAVHFYTDFITPESFLELASSDEKDLFRIATEGCTGSLHMSGLEKAVDLGSWSRADEYLNSIIGDLSYDLIGWVDWNMALNETGGPNWISNEVDSPIIVNGTADEFYKQPMFYALGHFSKFIVPGSVRIDTDTSGLGVTALSFVRPDGKIAVILRNTSSGEKSVAVNILDSTGTVTIEANSINTLLYTV